jgi:hypothetical protein
MKKILLFAVLLIGLIQNAFAANELSKFSEEEQIVFQEFSESIITGVNYAYKDDVLQNSSSYYNSTMSNFFFA